jgi:hypothetical protein
MTFAGLPLATLLGLGGAAAAATVLLYVLKLRRRPVPVPFSPIWQRVLKDKEASQLFSRLKRLLSLLLQLVLLSMLLVALGDPRPAKSDTEGRHLVVLVDASASMKATDGAPTRMDEAKRKLQGIIDGLGGADRVLVAEMGATLTPLSTLSGDLGELREATKKLAARDTRADFARGLSFALDSLRGLSRPEIVVISDGVLGDVEGAQAGLDLSSVSLSHVAVGERGNNVALTAFSVRRYPLDKSRYEVMLEVENTTEDSQEVELTLIGDGEVADVTRFGLAPGETLPRFYSDLGGASRRLEATLRLAEGADDLPADDHAYALMPERRRARVLVVTPGNTFLEAALLLDEYLDVTEVRGEEYRSAKGAFDVTIFDGVAPTPLPAGGGSIYLNPPSEGSPVEVGREIESFGFDTWQKKSPLLRWIALENIQVAEGHALVPEKDDQVVGASAQGPILVTGRRGGRRFVALGFDPRQSDFVLRVAWPLFVLNSIESFVEEEAGYVSSFQTGDVWRIPAPSDAKTAIIEDPEGRRTEVPVQGGRAFYLGERAGFYKLLSAAPGAALLSEFAGNLSDSEESHVKPIEKLELGGHEATAPAGFVAGVRNEWWIYLLLGVVLLSLLEWVGYHRRVTV